MTQKYIGHSFSFDEEPLEVTDAIIRKDRISVDFIEDGEPGHLEATFDVAEGVYRGNFGYPRPDHHYHAELRLYRAANGDCLLFGRYWWTSEPGGGLWLFHLSPETRA